MRMGRTPGQKAEADFCGSAGTILGTIQRTLIPGTFLFILAVGLTLNMPVIWILVFRVKRWNRSTIFLCNLALADITWILTLPFLIYYHLNQLHWIFGDALCKITRTIYHVCYYCSIYFVTCLSVDRYLAIVHPLKSLWLLNKQQSLLISLSIWAVTSLASVPVPFVASTQICPDNKTICSLYVFSSSTYITLPFSMCCTVVGCLLPFIAICYCYCSSVRTLQKTGLHHFQKKDKLTKLMYSVLIIFALLYFPYHLSRNTCIFLRALWPNGNRSIENADTVFFVEVAVCSLNTCINPLFCFLAGGDFRDQVCKIASSYCHTKTWRSQQQRTSVYPV
ncbi:P2Y purinoceptor 1-like [Trachemys scripta elegans]|uniref:P2Y purinoceptor 1-like n=1 Tax=Trachemys scripta elegans TaxID=31138 RepID=UPI0015567C56|nr:P2Y purinoceptor 1-like [Trachemys scripta elegans]XP_053881250.1 P2Y purinoceptor 1-like [Malaclemys terrapin pileata]